jgi:cystine transport system ATP-binding protein
MRFAKEVSNKVVFIHDGEIGEEGSPKELFDHPKTDELRRFLKKRIA